MQQLFDLQHKLDVEEIKLLETEIKQETLKIEKSVLYHLNLSSKIIKVNNIQSLAEQKSQTSRIKLIKNADTLKKKQILLAY